MIDVLHISTSDLNGGACRAASRIHQAQLNGGLSSTFFANHKLSKDPTVIAPTGRSGRVKASIRSFIDRLPANRMLAKQPNPCSVNWLPSSLIPHKLIMTADIVNLHFLGGAILPLSLAPVATKPIVWTLHDMWAFNGIEHYSSEADEALWRHGHKNRQSWFDRLDQWAIKKKEKEWRKLNLTIVCPSNWLADCARSSWLFRDRRIEVIPTPIDLDTYHPIAKRTAKEILGLDPERRHILFGADPANVASLRKGGDLLKAALKYLSIAKTDVQIVMFGGFPALSQLEGYDCIQLGSFTDDQSLALVYSAADCFVAPSRQDNLPNTVIESLACGTPVVAFDIGGMPDMIDANVGALAVPFEPKSLAASIDKVMACSNDRYQEACRGKALRNFAPGKVVETYLSLYEDLLK